MARIITNKIGSFIATGGGLSQAVAETLFADKAATEAALGRVETRVVDVRTVGLIGDGTTDETAALAAAIASNSGKVLSIPQDFTIRITGEVLSSVSATIIGHGHSSRIYVDRTTGHGLRFLNADKIHLENLSIVGRSQKDGDRLERAGVYIDKARKVVVRGVEFAYCNGYGLRALQAEDVWAQDNYCHDNYQGQVGGDLSFYTGLRSAVITGNICTSNVTSNIEINSVGGNNPVSGNTVGQIVVANNITDCQIAGKVVTSGYIDAMVGPTGSQEAMKHRRGINVSYTGGYGRVIVTGNTCLNGAWNGVYLNHSADAFSGPYLIANNLVKNFGFGDPAAAELGLYGGIHVTVAGMPNKRISSIISDNILEGGSPHAFAIKTSAEDPTVITHNLITNCAKGILDFSTIAAAQIEGNNISLVAIGTGVIEGVRVEGSSTNAPASGHIHIVGNIVRINTVGAGAVYGVYVDTSTVTRQVRVTDNVLDVLDNSGGAAAVDVRGVYFSRNQPTEFSRNHIKGFRDGVYFNTAWAAGTAGRGKVRIWANRFQNLTTGIVLRNSAGNQAALIPVWENTYDTVTNRTGADGFQPTALEVEAFDQASWSVTFRSATVPLVRTGFQVGDRCISTTLTSGTPMGWSYSGTAWVPWASYA